MFSKVLQIEYRPKTYKIYNLNYCFFINYKKMKTIYDEFTENQNKLRIKIIIESSNYIVRK